MEYLGKGLGTVGIWGGAAFMSSAVTASNALSQSDFGTGSVFIIAFVAAVFGTVAIWQ